MNSLPSILEKKLINRNTPLTSNESSFNKRPSFSNDSNLNRRTLIIGQGIQIQGTLIDVETLIVEGIIETSTIKLKKLVVQQTGQFHGTVEAQDIEITGVLEGDIVAQGNLIVTNTGRLLGRAKCRRLKVDDGGQITGQVEMITSEKLKPGPTTEQNTTKAENSDESEPKSDY